MNIRKLPQVRRQERRIGAFAMALAAVGFGVAATVTFTTPSAPSILFMVLNFQVFTCGLSTFKGWW